jgi:transposase-like protein
MQHPTLEKAAQAVGVNPSTLRRWRKQPEFQERCAEFRSELEAQLQGLLPQGGLAGFVMMNRLLADSTVAASTRFQVAKYLMDRADASRVRAQPSAATSEPPSKKLEIVFVDSKCEEFVPGQASVPFRTPPR